MIEFLCPNGHRIRCQASQAGRAAKCPRCGVRFRVPDATELDIPPMGESDSSVLRPEFTDSGVGRKGTPNTVGAATKQPAFEFLCPNGHRLHGPASLQGRPGECPDCGSRFRIPSYEDISAEEQTEEEIHLGRVDGHEGSGIHTPASAPPPQNLTPRARDEPRSLRHQRPRFPRRCPAKPIAALVARLWNIRPQSVNS